MQNDIDILLVCIASSHMPNVFLFLLILTKKYRNIRNKAVQINI